MQKFPQTTDETISGQQQDFMQVRYDTENPDKLCPNMWPMEFVR